MKSNLQIEYDEGFDENQQYRYMLSSLSTTSTFEDNRWICDKRRRSPAEQNNKLTVYFTMIPKKYLTQVKYFAIHCMVTGNGIQTVKNNVQGIGKYLNFLDGAEIGSANLMMAAEYKRYLDNSVNAESTKENQWAAACKFYSCMSSVYHRNPFMGNPFFHERLYDCKYIPKETAQQLDHAFRDESIPLHIRCIYWLLRLIPSRISEILGMKLECVKPFDKHYCILIPTWKQNGGYKEPLTRIIHVNDEGMGAYLLALIAEQQKRAVVYQEYLPKEKRGILLCYRQQLEYSDKICNKNVYRLSTWNTVSLALNRICDKNRICDGDGNLYRVTSHQFRHNGITDRLLAGFTPEQITDMTGHHGNAMMLASYAHFNLFPEKLLEPIEYKKGLEGKRNCILFCGRIINMDAANEERLLKNLRAHRIPGGICADVTHCKSGMWSCLDCESFIPEKEQLDFFKNQEKEWEEKAQRFQLQTLLSGNFKNNAQKCHLIVEQLQDMED